MIHVFMDDARPCPKGFVYAQNIEECLILLRECEVGVLSLDYDLGWNEPSGSELVRRMIEERLFPRSIYLHSSSWSGRTAMYQMLYAAKPEEVELFVHPPPPELLGQIAREAQQAHRRS